MQGSSGLCGMTGCKFSRTDGWRRYVCCAHSPSPLALLLSLILLCLLPEPEHSTWFWGPGACLAQCSWLLYSTMGECFKLCWVEKSSSWVWDKMQAPCYLLGDTCLQPLAAEGKKEGVCVCTRMRLHVHVHVYMWWRRNWGS